MLLNVYYKNTLSEQDDGILQNTDNANEGKFVIVLVSSSMAKGEMSRYFVLEKR